MKTTVMEIINEMQEKKIADSKIAPTAREDYLRDKLNIRAYVPFSEKQRIIEMVVNENITYENGIKKVNSISQYMGFVMAMLIAHTDLVIEDPFRDYDLLCEKGLLTLVVSLFQTDYDECDVLLKMALGDELADNNLSNVVSNFLNGILGKIDSFGDAIKGVIGNTNIKDILGDKFKEEDLVKLSDFLNRQNK